MKGIERFIMRTLLLFALLFPLGVWANESSPEQTLSTLWRAMSHDPGKNADVAALRRIFHDEAVVFGGSYKSEAPTMQRTSAKDFLKSLDGVSEKGFHECEVHREFKIYDRFAVAYSVVESRREKSAHKPSFTGINSIQLYKMGSQWQILSLYYHVEKRGSPIQIENNKPTMCIE